MQNPNELQEIYSRISRDINRQKRAFRASYKNEHDFFSELVFCLCTPQTSAHKSWNAAQDIMARGIYDSVDQTAEALSAHGVRFKNNKAQYIVEAMGKRQAIFDNIHDLFNSKAPAFVVRNWLVENVKGYGLKEAGHFLRNIGHGKDICILDRHILRCLVDFNVLGTIPKSLTNLVYFDIECYMLAFAVRIGIEPDDLDFVFWYRQNGEIFK